MKFKNFSHKLQRILDKSYSKYLEKKRSDRYVSPDEQSMAEKHSLKVSKLKKFILRVVILLCILVVVWPLAQKDWGGSKISFKNENNLNNKVEEDQGLKKIVNPILKEQSSKKSEASLPVMLKPDFYGNDDNNNPYNISADSGVNISSEEVVLSNINAQMKMNDGSNIVLGSKSGKYFNSKRELVLNGGVSIETDKGYILNTNSAFVDLDLNRASGSEKVNITGSIGDIESNGFTIKDTGKEIALFGGVRLEADLSDEDIDNFNKGKE